MERVKGMPIRVVIIKKIVDDRLTAKQLNPGQILELDKSSYELFNQNYPGCIQEIEMTQEDWIDLATNRVNVCKKRVAELEQLSGEKFEGRHYYLMDKEDSWKVDGSGYTGGLPVVYRKIHYLENDVKQFENQIFSNDLENGMHR